MGELFFLCLKSIFNILFPLWPYWYNPADGNITKKDSSVRKLIIWVLSSLVNIVSLQDLSFLSKTFSQF